MYLQRSFIIAVFLFAVGMFCPPRTSASSQLMYKAHVPSPSVQAKDGQFHGQLTVHDLLIVNKLTRFQPNTGSKPTCNNFVKGMILFWNENFEVCRSTDGGTSSQWTPVGAWTESNGDIILTDGGNLIASGGSAILPASAQGSGDRLLWYPAKKAFRAGGVTSTEWDDTNIGDYSTAFGIDTIASGDYSIAAGSGNQATADGAIAYGGQTNTATGLHATVIGGVNNFASGDSSIIVGGEGNVAQGNYATAMGRDSSANAPDSVAIGKNINVTSTATNTIAIGTAATPTTYTAPNVIFLNNNVAIAKNTAPTSELEVGGSIETTQNVTVGNELEVMSTSEFHGNVGVGSAPSATYALNIEGNANATGSFMDSDERLKTNIHRITNSIDKLQQIKGVHFEWLTGPPTRLTKKEGPDIGVIAQDIEKIFPEVVLTDENGYKAVDYSRLVAPLIEAVKDLADQNQALQDSIDQLEGRIQAQEAEITELKSQINGL